MAITADEARSAPGPVHSAMDPSSPPSASARALASLSWPIAASLIGEAAIGLVEARLLSGLGPAALGGAALGTAVIGLAFALSFGLARGVKVGAARAIGAGERPERYALAGVILGAILGGAITLALRDPGRVLDLLGTDPALRDSARDYLAARSLGAVGTAAGAALIHHCHARGDARAPLIVGLAGNALHATLAYVMIHGAAGMSARGVAGAGLAAAISETIELVALAAWTLRDRPRLPGLPAIGRAIDDILAIGVPTAIQFALAGAAFAAATAILAGLGAAQLAAHHLVGGAVRASFLPGAAIAEAASVLAARAFGRRRPDEAREIVRTALALALGVMTLAALVFATLGGPIARGLGADAETAPIARRLFVVAAAFQALDAVSVVLGAALRGAGEARAVAVCGTALAWICVPGAALVLGRWLGWGAVGVWVGCLLEACASALAMSRLWRARIEVEAPRRSTSSPGLALPVP